MSIALVVHEKHESFSHTLLRDRGLDLALGYPFNPFFSHFNSEKHLVANTFGCSHQRISRTI